MVSSVMFQLTGHLSLVTDLLGEQKGELQGLDLFFTSKQYARRVLRTTSPFYKEALKAMTGLDMRKQILCLRDEKIFHTPVFTRTDNHTLRIHRYCERVGVFTYGQLLDEIALRDKGQPHRSPITNLFDRLTPPDMTDREDYCLSTTKGNVKFEGLTQKRLYSELIKLNYRDHHSSAKWVEKLQTPVDWDKVWQTVHNRLTTKDTKSTIWEQIHLNTYTTYSYNKWHNREDTCPLCLQCVEDKFHILLSCPITVSLWSQLSPLLYLISPAPVTELEMVFGILGTMPAITLRNWLTFELRACIHQQENLAYHNQRGPGNELDIKRTYNATLLRRTLRNLLLYQHQGRIDLFEKHYMVNDALVSKNSKGIRLIATAFPTL